MAFEVIEPLTKENIYNRLDSIEIFKRYCKNFHEIGRFFKSEFREEKRASCRIDWLYGDFYLKDFGGDGWRPIGYVMRKFGLSWSEALSKINDDFCLGLGGVTYNCVNQITIERRYREKEQSVIRIKKRGWQDHDLGFWGKFGIKQTTLDLFNVVPISHFSINDRVSIADKWAYCYNFYWDTPTHYARKIYQPFNQNFKWLSTGRGVVQGECVLPYRNHLLIITSSLKDAMVFYEMGINSVAPPSESAFLDDNYFNKQKSRFDRVILNYDSDEVGIARSKALSEKYGLQYILTPEKDVSDTVAMIGMEKTKQIVFNLLNNLVTL